MPEPTSKPLAALAPLVEKVALELVYAAPGQDNGLLPVNALLTEMEAIAAASALPSPLEQAIRHARPWVDDALERACFEVVHLQLLHDWLEWMQVALPLAQAGHVLPQLPPARLLPASDDAHQPSGGETRL